MENIHIFFQRWLFFSLASFSVYVNGWRTYLYQYLDSLLGERFFYLDYLEQILKSVFSGNYAKYILSFVRQLHIFPIMLMSNDSGGLWKCLKSEECSWSNSVATLVKYKTCSELFTFTNGTILAVMLKINLCCKIFVIYTVWNKFNFSIM